jgi:hypothetical protein
VPVSKVISSNQKNIKYIDTLPKKASTLKYYVVNYSDSYVASNPSDTLSVYLPSVEKPLPPKQLDILIKDERTIKLIWVLGTQDNIKGYNVYLEKPVYKKLNTALIPISVNYFEINDTFNDSYTFSVESVGFNGDSSLYKTKASKNILSQYAKLVIDIKEINEGININWLQYPNQKIKKILLYRQSGNADSKLLKAFGNTNTDFTDKDVLKNTNYFYTVFGELENGDRIPLNSGLDVTY